MQEMPRGGMVGVRLSESELQQYLSADISIAALNAPKLSVLAGPLEAIEGLEQRLTSDGALFRRLRTSHAFHSSMMDPMLAEFEAEVAKISLHRPTRPYVSSFTGTWIQPEQATSPRFWADQVRNPVRFADALKTLMSTPQILLEVGPGNTLVHSRANSRTAMRPSSSLRCRSGMKSLLWRQARSRRRLGSCGLQERRRIGRRSTARAAKTSLATDLSF